MITAPSSDDNDNAQLFTLTVKSISQGRSTPLCLWPGLIWSRDTTQVGIQKQKLNICEMCRSTRQGEAQISTGEGRERNAECDPSWAHHYYGQGTHDTASIRVKTVTRLSPSEFRSTNTHFLQCFTLVCPVSTQPSLSLPNCWDRNQPPQWLTFMLSNKPGSCTSSNTNLHQLF